MGLDMYAVRRLSTEHLDHQPANEGHTVQIARGGKPASGTHSDRVEASDEDVMYWRKANHIHAWFVDNVQDGIDDQKSYPVDWDELRQLRQACETVMNASKLVDGMIDAGTIYNEENPKGLVQREPGKVIEDTTVAQQLLPTRSGFFFGCTEYDEDYLDEVVRTRDWAVQMLTDHTKGVPGDIHYSSWW
jgi:hypothetical protein